MSETKLDNDIILVSQNLGNLTGDPSGVVKTSNISKVK